ncbi:sister chromatid cohesion protein Dcc1 [Protomyces lactucae-debilis]|uniref:Sister chromatid cohesion protein Dcc1 n=1 Tax=Protomyces lactucae-debilis TaxID=2754530 RepID=A0A1Y2FV53_PROLT|nr:sister chromatid cohesion protein Dcc1 [Protomyces lactucae-debilis]ORY87891.1 sister chromatid cohesion protein Dcc1 [Protomyces lactucae-debilis]
MTAQILFSEDKQQYLLLQLDDALLGQPLVIKSASSSSSVLCTPTQTFTLKDVQQSNSLLFLADSSSNDLVVQGEGSSWLETTRVTPSIKLNLDIHNPDDGLVGKGFPADVLFSRIAASDAEIEAALSQELAIDLAVCGGFVELHVDYVLRLLGSLINMIQAADMQLTSVDEETFKAAAKDEEDAETLVFLLHRFSNGAPLCLDGDDICRYTGEAALKQVARHPCSLATFKAAWQEMTPVQYRGQAVALSLLEGSYVQPASNLIQYFAASSLSRNPKARLTQLFDVKERWREEEISTFLSSLVDGDAKAINSLIMKFARKVKIGKESFVEARR